MLESPLCVTQADTRQTAVIHLTIPKSSMRTPMGRFCAVTDPSGHSWSLATHVKDVSPEQAQAAASGMGGDCPDPAPQ